MLRLYPVAPSEYPWGNMISFFEKYWFKTSRVFFFFLVPIPCLSSQDSSPSFSGLSLPWSWLTHSYLETSSDSIYFFFVLFWLVSLITPFNFKLTVLPTQKASVLNSASVFHTEYRWLILRFLSFIGVQNLSWLSL